MRIRRRTTLSLQPARVPSYVACPNEPVVSAVFWRAQAPCRGSCLWVVNQQQSKELKLPAQRKLHHIRSVSLTDTIPVLLKLWMWHCIFSHNWENTFPYLVDLPRRFSLLYSPALSTVNLPWCKFPNELVFIKETNTQAKNNQRKHVPQTWAAAVTRPCGCNCPDAILTWPLFKAKSKPTQWTRQLSQLLTCTLHLAACTCAVTLSSIRRLQSIFSNTNRVSLEFSSVGEQKGIWAWRMSSNCLLFKGLCHNIDLFGI